MMHDARRARGPARLSGAIHKASRRAMARRGFAESRILVEWGTIVGPTLARATMPLKLAFRKQERAGGTLHLRVVPGFATEVQHLEPVILEKIATYCGYRAVDKLKILQGPVTSDTHPAAPSKVPRPPLTPEQEAALERTLAALPPSPLREALASLGKSVLSHRGIASKPDSAYTNCMNNLGEK